MQIIKIFLNIVIKVWCTAILYHIMNTQYLDTYEIRTVLTSAHITIQLLQSETTH